MSAPITSQRGDIVLVDLSGAIGGEKKNDVKINARPCVVIQNNRGNAVSPLTIVAPITDMAQYKKQPIQVLVTATELGAGGNDSVVECGHIRSVDKSRIQKSLGTLALAAMARIDQAPKVSLAL